MPTSRVARQPGASAVFGVASAMASISSLKAGHRALTPPVVMLPKNETRAAGFVAGGRQYGLLEEGSRPYICVYCRGTVN
jgi:hypothetical protein